jgi:hypothetical protein
MASFGADYSEVDPIRFNRIKDALRRYPTTYIGFTQHPFLHCNAPHVSELLFRCEDRNLIVFPE